MRRATCAIPVFLFLLLSHLRALGQLQVVPTIGIGYCYAKTENITPNLKPIAGPNGGVIVHVSVTNKIQLQTGIAFMQTGYNSEHREISVRASTLYTVKNSIDYISIPLLASYNAYSHGNTRYWIDAGLSYNFFASGKSHFIVTDYLNDVPTSTTTFDHRLNGPLIRKDIDPNAGRNDLTGLDLSFRIQIHTVWNKHYTASIYWDNGLYNILANPADASSISLHSIGISIGYIIL